MPLAAISRELGFDSELSTDESLQRTFEPLRSALLPAETVQFPPSPMAVMFLAACARFAERPAYRMRGWHGSFSAWTTSSHSP